MWFWLFAVVVLCFGLGALLGAPFLPVRKVDAEAALDLAELKAGQTLIDLGSGDGRLLLAAAQRGASAIGYEVNPIMYLWSLVVTWRYRRQISVRLQNFWRLPLPPADVIYIFLIDRYTARLDAKLGQEVARPTKVVSYVFELPRQPIKSTRNTHLYLYP
jgi:SAM-dependent methyltransferase